MTVCPVAVLIGCKSCPVVKLCPTRSILGNYQAPKKSLQRKKGRRR